MSESPTFTTSDRVRLAYAVDDFTDPWKPKETVILLHAAMSSSRRFYAWVPLLARHLRVVRLDMRGHDGSEAPGADKPVTIERLGRDVLELVDHLQLGRVHLSGSSAGGYVAQWLAIHHPARVGKLALFSSTPGLSWARPGVQVPTWPATVREKGVDGLLRDTVAARVDPARVDAGFVLWMLDETKRMDRDFTARFLETMAALDLAPDVHEIKAPTLIVVAGGDTVCKREGYEALRGIPAHEWVVYEGLPHNITNGVPDRCALELRRFLVGS
jgi:pimeloyl-ACP methyl ester carboxylesterase